MPNHDEERKFRRRQLINTGGFTPRTNLRENYNFPRCQTYFWTFSKEIVFLLNISLELAVMGLGNLFQLSVARPRCRRLPGVYIAQLMSAYQENLIKVGQSSCPNIAARLLQLTPHESRKEAQGRKRVSGSRHRDLHHLVILIIFLDPELQLLILDRYKEAKKPSVCHNLPSY